VGLSRVVLGSSSWVYGDSTPIPFREDATAVTPVSPYAATKRAAELLLVALAPLHGFRVASLRLFTVYGARQRPDLAIHSFARRLAQGQPLTLYGDGSQARDYTYFADVVHALLAAVDWTVAAPVGVDIFNVGGARPVPLRRLVSTLAGAMGVEPRVEWAPMPAGDVQRTCADLEKSRRVLGYDPRISLDEGIARFVTWFRGAYAQER
jgi:UDP-glucuronate 4-epimerase